jgi:hypothetical protein
MNNNNNREAWLISAVNVLARDFFTPLGASVPEVRVSTGFPRGSRGKNKAIGQCWAGICADDKRPQIFIHPELVDSSRVLDVLIHELVHATVGHLCGHKGNFKTLAVALGLAGQMTATHASDELKERLNEVIAEIGEYPHAKLNATESARKQSTRLIKCECTECGYIARTSAKWLDELGAPLCPCGAGAMLAG